MSSNPVPHQPGWQPGAFGPGAAQARQTADLAQQLSPQQVTAAEGEAATVRKSKGVGYALWFFLGLFGGHRFYAGKTGSAVAQLLLGWATLFIWNLVDVFFLGRWIDEWNMARRAEIYRRHAGR